jgi:hypothetical protein
MIARMIFNNIPGSSDVPISMQHIMEMMGSGMMGMSSGMMGMSSGMKDHTMGLTR